MRSRHTFASIEQRGNSSTQLHTDTVAHHFQPVSDRRSVQQHLAADFVVREALDSEEKELLIDGPQLSQNKLNEASQLDDFHGCRHAAVSRWTVFRQRDVRIFQRRRNRELR